MSKTHSILRTVTISCIHLALLGTLLESCKSVGDAPNRRYARRLAMKQAATGGSVFKSNRLANSSVDGDVAGSAGSEPVTADASIPGDVVKDDGGFIPTSVSSNPQPGKPDGKDGTTSNTQSGKPDDCVQGKNTPSQTASKTDLCGGASKPLETPPVTTTQTSPTPAPTTNPTATPTPTPTPVTTPATPTSTPTATTTQQPSNPVPTQPPKESCNMFVHLRGHKPEWTAVFIPAQSIPPNQADTVIFGIANLRIPNCNWPTQRSCVKGAYIYSLDTNGQPGSTDCQTVYSKNYSPLIIDMMGRGIVLTYPKDGVNFDIEGTGEKLSIAWPIDTANTPFLALDSNNNGNIDSVHELFGNNTKGPDGKTAENGFAALAKYDINGDKTIDAKDAVWNQLRFWRDLNRDGASDASELTPVSVNRIVSIDLDYVSKQENADAFGNSTLQRSVVEMRSGKLRNIFDLWFVPNVVGQ